MRLVIVSYDIADDQRRADVAKRLLSYGRRLQYSVYECALGSVGRAELRAALDGLIHHEQDQILIFDLGPLDGRAQNAIEALGRRYGGPDVGPVVL